jgi:hypothetical protein
LAADILKRIWWLTVVSLLLVFVLSEHIRAQPTADLTQLERAKLRAGERDIGGDKGNAQSRFSIASIPNEVVVARAAKLGVSLGLSPSLIESSVNTMKEIDLQRTLVILKRNEDNVRQDNGSDLASVVTVAKKLSSDLDKEEQQGSEGHEDPTLPSV